MSSRLPAAIMLALCLGILCLAAPSRASTVWLYGGTNNASVYGVTADTALSIGCLFRAQELRLWRFGPSSGKGAQLHHWCVEDVCRTRAGNE